MSNESHDGLEGEEQQNVPEVPVQEHVEEHTREANEKPSSSGPDSDQREQQKEDEPRAVKLGDPGTEQNRDVSVSRQLRQRKEVSEQERQRREERRRRENERRLEGQRREFERKREARKKAAEEEAARTRAQTQCEDGGEGEPQRRTENEEEEEAPPWVEPELRSQRSESPGTADEMKLRTKKKKKTKWGKRRATGTTVTKVVDQKDAENVAAAESGALEHDAGAARLTIAEEEKEEHSKSFAIAHPTSVVSSGYAPPSPPITPRDLTCPPLGYGYASSLLCDMEDWQTSMESDYLFEAPLLRWLTVPAPAPLLEGAQTRQDTTDLLFLEPSLGRSSVGGAPSSSDGIDIPKVKICHAAAPTHAQHSRNGDISIVSGETREPETEPAQRAQRGRGRSRGRGFRRYRRGGRGPRNGMS